MEINQYQINIIVYKDILNKYKQGESKISLMIL